MRTLVVMLLSTCAVLAQTQSSIVEIPANVPAGAQRFVVTMMGNTAGWDLVWKTPDGKLHQFFAFNDRGRGSRLTESIQLAPDGTIRSLDISGNDYYKTPVSESFTWGPGRARWKNSAENGSSSTAAPALYVPMNGGPLDDALLVKAALSRGGAVALLPGGEARVDKVAEKQLEKDGRRTTASLYSIRGINLAPSYIWVDDSHDLFAEGGTWFMTIREGWETAAKELVDIEQKIEAARGVALAKKLAHHAEGPIEIRNVNLFDSETASIVPGRTVLIDGTTIQAVGDARTLTVPPNATIVDGSGKTLLPGLWDMHAHVADNDGLLNLAAGVTTVRDLANNTEELEARRKRIDDGEELGTRIFPAGFIDGPGPYQGPTNALADTEAQAREYVAKYAALGYKQIKIYSSLKPSLVPVIVEEAHKRGMRVSGHIPAGMIAEDAVRAGFDELQHANFLLLNFMPDVKDKTQTIARLIEPAKRGADVDIASAPVQAFIALLKSRQVAIDPTLAAFEEDLVTRAGVMPESYAWIADRLPAQFRRSRLAGGLPVAEGMDSRYKASFAKMLAIVKACYDAGIPIESGTDSLAGFTLERELELHVRAGIPAARVLADSTLGAARIMKEDQRLGSIAAGKLADVVLIDGDPVARIGDIRRPSLVIKNGVIYKPSELFAELGIQPAR
jgi:imidazolonepropionase-like amidohydrolase